MRRLDGQHDEHRPRPRREQHVRRTGLPRSPQAPARGVHRLPAELHGNGGGRVHGAGQRCHHLHRPAVGGVGGLPRALRRERRLHPLAGRTDPCLARRASRRPGRDRHRQRERVQERQRPLSRRLGPHQLVDPPRLRRRARRCRGNGVRNRRRRPLQRRAAAHRPRERRKGRRVRGLVRRCGGRQEPRRDARPARRRLHPLGLCTLHAPLDAHAGRRAKRPPRQRYLPPSGDGGRRGAHRHARPERGLFALRARQHGRRRPRPRRDRHGDGRPCLPHRQPGREWLPPVLRAERHNPRRARPPLAGYADERRERAALPRHEPACHLRGHRLRRTHRDGRPPRLVLPRPETPQVRRLPLPRVHARHISRRHVLWHARRPHGRRLVDARRGEDVRHGPEQQPEEGRAGGLPSAGIAEAAVRDRHRPPRPPGQQPG